MPIAIEVCVIKIIGEIDFSLLALIDISVLVVSEHFLKVLVNYIVIDSVNSRVVHHCVIRKVSPKNFPFQKKRVVDY